MSRLALLAMWSTIAGLVAAQDTRKVLEPTVPPVCTALIAKAPLPASTETDTARIQNAIEACPAGRAVRLAAGIGQHAFTAGPLTLKSGVTLLIDRSVTLYASTDPRAYDQLGGTCGKLDTSGKGCKPFITADRTDGSGIMGEGIIDGRGGHVIDGKTESWWQLARRAQRERSRQNVPRLIEVNNSREFTLYRVTLRNSPNFHVTLSRVDGFTAWGVRIDSPADARNTDGIDPISSRNVTIAHSFIRTGDDNIAIKAGSKGPTENISILHNHFYRGHGMSIGSETFGGVRNVLVEELTIDGATSGLRIKSDVSRGGQVQGVRYRNVCLRNVKAPLDIDTRYDAKARGSNIPWYRNIGFERVHSLTPGRITLRGFDVTRPLVASLDDVVIDGASTLQIAHAELALGPGPVSPLLVGENLRLMGNPSSGIGVPCESRFVPFPEIAVALKQDIKRPQLTPAQAETYSYAEVLKYSGATGRDTIDAWDPLADPLATSVVLTPDYTVDAASAANGKTTFNSVQGAVSQAVSDSAATASRTRQFILVKPGVYRELLYIPAASVPITIYGVDTNAANTVIRADLHAGTTGETYTRDFGTQFASAHSSIASMYASLKDKSVVGTPGSAIAWVRNNGFQAKNITFENAWNRGDVVRETPVAITTQLVQTFNQAVALMVEDADKVQFENVRFLGLQDTLFLTSSIAGNPARSFFNRAYIEGDTDFIFGDTTAFFFQSEIRSLGARKNISYVTAASTNVQSKFGFVFNGCRFTNDMTANALAGKFHLGRQWFRGQRCTPYNKVAEIAGYACRVGDRDILSNENEPIGMISKGVLESVGKVIVMNSRIGAHIDPARPWHDWNKPGARQYRPAQYTSDDYWKNLVGAGIDPVGQLGYAAKKSPAEPFLAEFNNRDE